MKEMNVKIGFFVLILCYYEKEGIFFFVECDENGKCFYNDMNIEWICFILVLCLMGMFFVEIKCYVEFYK